MDEFLKIFSIFFTGMLGWGKVSVPSAVAFFDFNFWKVIGITCSGGITGAIVFTNISDMLMKWWHKIKMQYFRNHVHPKVFTKANRRIIKIKKRFGIWGIAFCAPIFLSIPVGAFVAERFYKNKKKVILAISITVLFWNTIIYFLLVFFYESLKRFL
ncbi:MAG TPA: hypothetical protein VN026_03375 [Bacteroidia bacterium]|jgi:hypothetical protein|nr:hypothetical protein [Bacteroidia bacterium]